MTSTLPLPNTTREILNTDSKFESILFEGCREETFATMKIGTEFESYPSIWGMKRIQFSNTWEIDEKQKQSSN
jgi:hypothetical protein